MKRMLLLVVVTTMMAVMLVGASTAMAQEITGPGKAEEKKKSIEIPKTGGVDTALLLPATVLLLGTGLIGLAVVRRRR